MSRARPAEYALDERECNRTGGEGSTSASEFVSCCGKTLYSEEAIDELAVVEYWLVDDE